MPSEDLLLPMMFFVSWVLRFEARRLGRAEAE
jgi:hypothetical protein